MAQKIKDQGGAASSNPSGLKRWIGSKVMQRTASLAQFQKKRDKAEKLRVKKGLPHRVEYYHQVDDPYSHLAAQTLLPLLKTYDIEIVPHLTEYPEGNHIPEPELLKNYALRDSVTVASHYGLKFPKDAKMPVPGQIDLANRILASVNPTGFLQASVDVGHALWSGNDEKLGSLAVHYGESHLSVARAAIKKGTEKREKLGHYSGAMFYYGGEWYWGVDRLYHLENRLIELGARKPGISELIVSRPEIDTGEVKDNGTLTLEFYPSLRSPYTSIIFDRTIRMVEDSGVKMVMRPVIPMVMRGVSLSRQKGLYIIFDTAREARTLGLEWGKSYDPIGEPILRAFSLYPWARKQGREIDFIRAFLRAAFFDGVNTNRKSGLKTVVENAGLFWEEARPLIGNTDWERELEENRLAMLDLGIWGVPTYRLLDGAGSEVLSVWGQDRLWLVAREIKRLLSGQDQ